MFRVSKRDKNGMALEVEIDYEVSFGALIHVDSNGVEIERERLTKEGWIIDELHKGGVY